MGRVVGETMHEPMPKRRWRGVRVRVWRQPAFDSPQARPDAIASRRLRLFAFAGAAAYAAIGSILYIIALELWTRGMSERFEGMAREIPYVRVLEE